MKRLIALMMVVATTCCLTGSASAKHGWGTGGDSTFAATTIYDLQQNGTPSGNSALTGHPVVGDTMKYVGKIITAIDTKPNSFGFWIEEPAAGAYSGVLVYTGTDNPFAAGYRVGDIVTVQGLYAEFGSAGITLTEVNTGQAVAGGGLPFATYVNKTGHTVPPAPKRLVTGVLRMTDPACVEPWEGVLAVLDSVYVQSLWPFSTGVIQQIAANVPPACMGAGIDTCHINPKLIAPNPVWTVGHQYSSVVGVVSQEFGAYYIAPRDLTNDLQDLGAPAPPDLTRAFALDATHVLAFFDKEMEKATAEDPTNYDMLHATVVSGSLSTDSLTVTLTVSGMVGGTADSLLVFGVRTNSAHVPMIGTQSRGFRDGITSITQVQTPGALHDSSAIVNEVATVQGVVTVGSSTFGGGAVFIADPAGGGAPYTGLETFAPPTTVAIGDNVTMAGTVAEFNNKTELTTFYTVINSSGNALPPPANVTVSQINNAHPASAELYEDMYLATTGTVASDTVVGSGTDWFLNVGADTIKVGRNADGGYNFTPTPGDQVSMCAILDYNATGFILQPRNHQDMYCGPSGPLGVGSGNVRFALRQSAPNPFSRFTQIHYSIANTGPASLKIYNVTGQLVRTLLDGAGRPGEYSTTWDGRTQSGRPASSGIYYYRLNSGSQSLTRKLVLSR